MSERSPMIRDKHSSGEDRHMTEMTTTPFTQNATELSEIPTSDPESPDLDPDYELPYRWHLKSVHKRKSALPPNFLKVDDGRRDFLKSVKNRNFKTVKENLKKDPALATLITIQGVSALEEAVKSGSVEMIKLFMNKTSKKNRAEVIEHALLYAIKENSLDILEYLLKEREEFWDPIPKKKEVDKNAPKLEIVIDKGTKNKSRTWNDRKTKIPGYEDAEYAPYITPIILAAKLERQDMIKILLEHNASEIHPLTAPCPFEEGRCEICSERKVFKSKRNLEDSKRLLEIYKALSSPAYIFLSGVKDPILEAFYLSKEMCQMQEEDPSFKAEYEAIAKQCRSFATELLSLCRTTSEVEVLLKNKHGVEDVNSEGDKTEYPRVLVCLHYSQIEFIAHPYTQQVLQKNWFDGLPEWFSESEFHYLKWFLYWLIWIPSWPVCCFLFMLKIPWFVRLMKKPINKFITDTLSTIAFLIVIVIISTAYQSSDIEKLQNFHTIEYIFIVWLFGMTCRQAKMLWRRRQMCRGCMCCSCGTFINRNIRWFDMCIFLSFWLWTIFQTAGIIEAKVGNKYNKRNWWTMGHPILISEAFFALGTILSFLRLTSLLKASSSLGPLQISLKNMIRDTLRFMVIFVIIMTGFVIATTGIYSHYKDNKRIETGEATREQSDHYIGVQNTYKTYFWDIFGYGEVQYGDIVVNYNDSNETSTRDIPKHKFTELVGYLIIASYYIIAVVVLLNMLIAMMANSFNSIAANADSEWKFARTRLWMTYYSEVGSLPPPFNVVLLGTITKYIVQCCAKTFRCCKAINNAYRIEPQKDEIYEKLIENLNKRYWNHRGDEERRQILISRDQLDRVLEDYRVTETTQQKINLSSV